MMSAKWLKIFFGLSLGAVMAASAYAAESSYVFKHYIEEGVKAYDQHQDDEASRYFTWARQIDPNSKVPAYYLNLIRERAGFVAAKPSPSGSTYADEIVKKGIEQMKRREWDAAYESFYTAHLLNMSASKPLAYMNLVRRLREKRVVYLGAPELDEQTDGQMVTSDAVNKALNEAQARLIKAAVPAKPVVKEAKRPVPVGNVPGPEKPAESQKKAKKAVKPNDKDLVQAFTFADIQANATNGRALLKVILGGAVILEGRNVQRFLVLNEGVFSIKIISRDQVRLDGIRIGRTYLHVWDDNGRHTIFVEVSLPEFKASDTAQGPADVEHSNPMRLKYSNEWSSYYDGPDYTAFKRRNLYFRQGFGMEIETPYGLLDAAGSTSGLDPVMNFTSYTAGLTDVPVPGLSRVGLRVFDATRTTSGLTLSGVSLRGFFADALALHNNLGVSLTHGQEKSTFGVTTSGSDNKLRDAYIDAIKLSVFPLNPKGNIGFNYVQGSGADRSAEASTKVYSIDALRKIDKFTVNGEFARSDHGNAGTTGVRWQDGVLSSGLNYRQTDMQFASIKGASGTRGDKALTWSGAIDDPKLTALSTVDIYQGKLYANPDNPDSYNLDVNASASWPVAEVWTLGGGLHYVNAAQDISPRTLEAVDARLSRLIKIWNKRQASVYASNSYQRSRFEYTPSSDYDRYSLRIGGQMPLTNSLSCFASYDISWLSEPFTGNEYSPKVVIAGLSYFKTFRTDLNSSMTLSYRKEIGQGGINSFLSGEDSLSGSASLTYNMTKELDVFMDSRLSRTWGRVSGTTDYDSMDLRMGMRGNWGVPVYWDPQGTIEGVVFKDANANGRFNKGEEGIANVKIKVGDSEVMTDAKGWYHAVRRAKRVLVSPAPGSIPSGYVFSTPTFARVKVRQGLRDRVDFGLTTQSGVFGIAFVDKNGNGIPDEGDMFLDRVRILLDGKDAESTDGSGTYFFKSVTPGKHMVSIDMLSLPDRLIPLIKLRNEVEVVEATTYVFHIPMKIKDSESSNGGK